MKRNQFSGIDADIETSLFEYGLLIAKNSQCSPDQFFCIVGVGMDGETGNWNRFDTGYIGPNDLHDNWIEESRVESFSPGFRNSGFINEFTALIQYYGSENFGFGTYSATLLTPETLDAFLLPITE